MQPAPNPFPTTLNTTQHTATNPRPAPPPAARRPGTTKRPRAHQHADVAPPSSEALPTKASLSLADLQQRFEQLKREANRYAAETGHSVALFSVGAVLDASLEVRG